MSPQRIKKLSIFALAISLLVAVPLLSGKANAVFKGPNPVTNGKIAFGGTGGKAIKTANPDGSQSTAVFTDNAAAIVGNPVWSPDKTKIAFVISKDNDTEIYTINPDGSNKTQVTTTSGSVGPTWSPDGTKILFVRDDGGTAPNKYNNLYVIDADGTNETKLSTNTNPAQNFNHPAWSPVASSRKIVYSRGASSITPLMDGDVYLAEINSGFTALTSNTALEGAHETDRGEYDPQFSPNGDEVIFVRKTLNGSYSISSVSADNSNNWRTVKQLNVTANPIYGPAYSPDKKFLAYDMRANNLSVGKVMIVDLDADTERMFSAGGSLADWTYAGEGSIPSGPLEDVYITCTTRPGVECKVSVPTYCTNTLSLPPAHGLSTIVMGGDAETPGEGLLTYVPAVVDGQPANATEENYVHVRSNSQSTANCYVKIKFDGAEPGGGTIVNIPKTGVVGGLIGVGLAAAVAGGAIYYKEYKNKKSKLLSSEK